MDVSGSITDNRASRSVFSPAGAWGVILGVGIFLLIELIPPEQYDKSQGDGPVSSSKSVNKMGTRSSDPMVPQQAQNPKAYVLEKVALAQLVAGNFSEAADAIRGIDDPVERTRSALYSFNEYLSWIDARRRDSDKEQVINFKGLQDYAKKVGSGEAHARVLASLAFRRAEMQKKDDSLYAGMVAEVTQLAASLSESNVTAPPGTGVWWFMKGVIAVCAGGVGLASTKLLEATASEVGKGLGKVVKIGKVTEKASDEEKDEK